MLKWKTPGDDVVGDGGVEIPVEDGIERLGHEPLAPIGFAEPVAEFGDAVLVVEAGHADGALAR